MGRHRPVWADETQRNLKTYGDWNTEAVLHALPEHSVCVGQILVGPGSIPWVFMTKCLRQSFPIMWEA